MARVTQRAKVASVVGAAGFLGDDVIDIDGRDDAARVSTHAA